MIIKGSKGIARIFPIIGMGEGIESYHLNSIYDGHPRKTFSKELLLDYVRGWTVEKTIKGLSEVGLQSLRELGYSNMFTPSLDYTIALAMFQTHYDETSNEQMREFIAEQKRLLHKAIDDDIDLFQGSLYTTPREDEWNPAYWNALKDAQAIVRVFPHMHEYLDILCERDRVTRDYFMASA